MTILPEHPTVKAAYTARAVTMDEFVRAVKHQWREIDRIEISITRMNMAGIWMDSHQMRHYFPRKLTDICTMYTKSVSVYTNGQMPAGCFAFTDFNDLPVPLAAAGIAEWIESVLMKELNQCLSSS